MKKLIAILFSVLMLCALIPFATVAVSAEDLPTIEVVIEETEVNAGDELEVTVNLLGLEDTDGLIYANVKINYDPAAFELVTYFDEDEEAWMPPIEVGSKYNASSNKYIMFGQIFDDGTMKDCLVKYQRGTASATQVRREEHFYTVTFKVKDDAPSGTYDFNVANGANDKTQLIYYGSVDTDFNVSNASVTVNGSEPTPPACEHEYFSDCDKICMNCGEETRPEAGHNVAHVEAKDATCYENGNIEYWYCEVCGSAWLDADCIRNTNLMSVVLPMGHGTITHVEAKDATCFEPGNIEYWFCEDCGQAWLDAECNLNTNLMAVVLPISHNVIHVEALEPTCFEPGNIEYWYCEDCGSAWLDELCHLNTNMMAVKLGASCKYGAEYVAAKDATCYEPGNVEYWYCANCDVFYADADCTIITNAKNVVLPISHNIIHVEALEPTCTELGNIEYWYCEDCGSAWLDELCHLNTNLMAVKLGTIDHTYDNAHDADCNVCGAIRDVVLGADEIILFGGNSVTEIRGGLAFRFDAAVEGIVYDEEYYADYTNATVTIDGVEYKLIGMGAIMNNKGYANQTLENVDDTYVLNVEAAKVFDEFSFAVRIINIPEAHLDTQIIARPYFIYEADGEQIVVYGEDESSSYNDVLYNG